MDNLSVAQRRATMRAVRSKDTAPEMIVRRLVHALGRRYRLHVQGLPGCPDLVFPLRRKAIFVHGCFWHGHSCPAGLNVPRSNERYWGAKLERNKARDERNKRTLRALGWRVLTIWECQLKRRPDAVAVRLAKFLVKERATASS